MALSDLTDILSPFPYTFYARILENKLDLVVFENIDMQETDAIYQALNTLELGYEYTVANWVDLSLPEQEITEMTSSCVQASPGLMQIQKAVTEKFEAVAKACDWSCETTQGVVQTQAPYASAFLNVTCGASFVPDNATEIIARVKQAYEGAPFSWWVGPLDQPKDLSNRLIDEGFNAHEATYVMTIAPRAIAEEVPADFLFEKAVEPQHLKDMASLLMPMDEEAASFFNAADIQQFHAEKKYDIFLLYADKVPIAMASLFKTENLAVAFDIIVSVEHQGHGLGDVVLKSLAQVCDIQGEIEQLAFFISGAGSQAPYVENGAKTQGFYHCFDYNARDKDDNLE